MHPCFFNKRKQNYAYKKRQKCNSLSVLGINLFPPSVLSTVLFIKKKEKKNCCELLAQVVRIMPLSSWLLSPVPGAQPSPAPIVPYPLQKKPRGVTKVPLLLKVALLRQMIRLEVIPGCRTRRERRRCGQVRECVLCLRALWMLPKLP